MGNSHFPLSKKIVDIKITILLDKKRIVTQIKNYKSLVSYFKWLLSVRKTYPLSVNAVSWVRCAFGNILILSAYGLIIIEHALSLKGSLF